MRLRFDELCKQLLTAAFAPGDRVERNAELDAADAQKVDLRIEPRPAGDAARTRAGLLGRMVGEGPCHVEHFAEAPSSEALLEAVRKTLTARRRQSAPPRLWLLCAGRPSRALSALGFARHDADPPGFYRLAPAWATSLTVLGELSPSRETLLLRLLGRGTTFARALRELTALPHDVWERQTAWPIVERLRFTTPETNLLQEPRSEAMAGDPSSQEMTEEEEAALMAAVDIMYRDAERIAVERGLQRGLERGLEQGLEQGIQRGLEQGIQRGLEQGRRAGEAAGEARALLAVLEARGLAVGEADRARIVACTDPRQLEAWVRRAVSVAGTAELFDAP